MDYRLSTQEARSHLAAYHHWLLKSRPAEAYAAASKYQQIVELLNGGTNQGSYVHAQSAGSQIRDKLSAPEGRMPMWGQKGSFILQHQGITALVTSTNVPNQTCLFQISLQAVQPYALFISNTGYSSIIVSGFGWNLREAICTEIDALLTNQGCVIDEDYRDVIQVPAWAAETNFELRAYPESTGQLRIV
ncbi:hypothetical protein [Alcaligenes faecalis]|uniref:hypothetical protein n=1 Tax=Alcaligenes faecalis TaxID=511 RepID=UPI0034D43D29